MGTLYWSRSAQFVNEQTNKDHDFLGLAQVPDNGNDRIRRNICNFYIEFSNVDTNWINQFGGWGMYVSLQVLADSVGPPTQFRFPDGADFTDRVIHYELLVGESYRKTATGVEIFRFPSGGGTMKVDTPAQRKPIGFDHLNVWLTWSLNISNASFDKTVLKARAAVSSSTLWETVA